MMMRAWGGRRASRLAAVLAATLLVAPLAACGDDGADGGPVTLQFTWWGNDARAAVTEKAVDLFEQRHPNIRVNTSFGAFDAYFQKLSTQIAGGDAPDVLQMDRAYIREYADRNALLDLSDEISDGTLKVADLSPTLLPAGKVGEATFAVPIGQNTQGVIYDPAIWARAGAAEPTATWTWDDMLRAGTAISQSTGGKVAGFGDFGYAIDWFDIWLNQRGKSIYTGDGKLGFGPAELTEFWTLTGRLRDAKALAPASLTTQLDGSIQNSSLVKKGAAAEVNYDSAYTALTGAYGAPLKIGPVPSDTDRRGMVAHKSMSLSVARSSEHPKEAAQLIDFLVNDVEAGRLMGVSRGLPANGKVREAIAAGLPPADRTVYDYEQSVAAILLPTPPAQPPGGGAIKTEFQRVYDEVIFGRLPVDRAAKQLVDEATGQLG